MAKAPNGGPPVPEGIAVITLYVAGAKGRASSTVERLTQEAKLNRAKVALNVVDVLDDPGRAEQDAVLTTPMLVRWSPGPVRRVAGDIAGIAQLLPDEKEVAASEPSAGAADATPESASAENVSIISRAAHELRTPLAVIRGFATTLSDAVAKLDRETEIKCAEAIVRGSTQLQTILDSMLVVDAVQREGVHLNLTEVTLGGLVVETVSDLSPLTNKHPVALDVVDDVYVRVDPVKVRQIITNLISNAVKFTAAGAPIKVTVQATPKFGCLIVEDSGPGIPEEFLERIFDQYERVGSQEKGMGLGLYISRRLAIAHEGNLTASNGDSGARFELQLPRL